jgi:alpha-amylase
MNSCNCKTRIFLIILALLAVLSACAIPSPTATATLALPTFTNVPSATSLPTSTATLAPTSTPNIAAVISKNWWNRSVFYEIFVRSFFDTNGDGKGDLNGVTAKLDYLKNLGITGIWLMPINPSPSYHGYDVTDYYSVNPDYGTLDDFKTLLREAHLRGIKVIIDFVLNHTSDQHPWFKAALDPASKYHNWYIWSDTNPGTQGVYGDAWHKASNGLYYYGVFTAQMPDLNYRNPEVTQEMEKVTQFWLKDIGIDGFRLDAAQYLIEEGKLIANTNSTHAWFKQYRQFYKSINPQAIMVGEIDASSNIVSTYVNKGDQLDLAFDFNGATYWINGVAGRDARTLMSTTYYEYTNFLNEQVATFLTNHDQNRVMSQLQDDLDRAKAAATILLTAPGVPFIYYGEEIGMDGTKPDQRIRSPMEWTSGKNGGFSTGLPWESLNEDYSTKNVAVQNFDPDSLLTLYRDLIHIRSQQPALQFGELVNASSGNDSIFVSLRINGNEGILTLINLSAKPVSDYKLSFSKTSLTGSLQVGALYGVGSFSPLTVTASGGIDSYQPISQIPANANLVLLLK